MIICIKCGEEKPATTTFFYMKNGSLRTICKKCHSVENRINYLKNKEKVNERALARWAANRDHYRALNKAWARRYRKLNHDRHRRIVRKWYDETREQRNSAQRVRYTKVRQSPIKRLDDAVRARVRQMVRKNGESRSRYLPFSSEVLKIHLERQFTKEMSWRNFGRGSGKWNIDHIIPLSSFRYESMKDVEFKAAWALTNLRPLWEDENLTKGATRTHLL